MKKIALTVILPLCAVMAMTACGGNADTAEVEETTVIAESTEDDEQEETKTEASTVVEEAIEESEVVEEEVIVEEEPEEPEITVVSKYEGLFYSVSQDVLDNDKSDEYGIYSESCFDLDQYLDEEGNVPGYWNFDSDESNYYTGRWAYPEIIQCNIFNDMCLFYKTDVFEKFTFNDKSGNESNLAIASGIYGYNFDKELSEMAQHVSDGRIPVFMFTAETMDGTTDVYSSVREYNDDTTSRYSVEYMFNIGNFSITVQCAETLGDENPIEMTEEELQEIIDNIRLTNGLER